MKHIFTVMFAVYALFAGEARSQAYSPEQIETTFPKISRTPVRFLECRNRICSFQSVSPMAAVLFMIDESAQNIKMVSITFHSSKAQLAAALMKDALRFALYPEGSEVDMRSSMKIATPSGKDVELQKGFGLRLVNLTSVDKNVFSFRFYRINDWSLSRLSGSASP